VPSQFQTEYNGIESILNSFNSSLGATPTTKSSFVVGTELLPANGNRGPALFQSTNLVSVNDNLNLLQAMGVKAVTFPIGYPLLDPTFPNSSQYLSYFKQVVQMIHAKGMKVLIESQILFANTPYSPITYNWSSLPYSQYITNHIAQDQLIINQIKPDYLEIGVEADTEASLSGYTQLDTVSDWTSYINTVLNSLNKTGSITKLVAGAATWLGVSWAEGFANNPNLDYISTHVYPIYGNNIQSLIQMGQLAKQDGKPLAIDETWEEKVIAPPGNGQIGAPSITQQDVFGYWSPVDVQWLQLLAKFSEIYPAAYISPYYEDYFFAYLNWTPALNAQDFFTLSNTLNPISGHNIQNYTISPTGAYLSTMVHSSA
jgi:hypothetical protein